MCETFQFNSLPGPRLPYRSFKELLVDAWIDTAQMFSHPTAGFQDIILLGITFELRPPYDEDSWCDERKNIIKEKREEDCPICLDSIKSPLLTNCAHLFCAKCLGDIDKCPLCRQTLNPSRFYYCCNVRCSVEVKPNILNSTNDLSHVDGTLV